MSKWKPLVSLGYQKKEVEGDPLFKDEVKVFLRRAVVETTLKAALADPDAEKDALAKLAENPDNIFETEETEESGTKKVAYFYFPVTSPEEPKPPLLVDEEPAENQENPLLRIEMHQNLFDVIEAARIAKSEIGKEYIRLVELEYDPEKFVASVLGADSWPCIVKP